MKRLLALFLLLASPAQAQNVFFAGNPGDMIYRGPTAWQRVPGGTAGQILQSNGPTAAPTWSNGFDVYTTYGFVLPRIATNRVLGNVTGVNAAPVPVTATQFLDTIGYDIVRPPTIGSILFKDSVTTNWQALQPGPAGFALLSGGAGVNPSWGFVAGAATPGAAGGCLVSNGVGVAPTYQSCLSAVSFEATAPLVAAFDGVLKTTVSCPTCLVGASAFANPTASVGLTAVNGTATTAIRSDAAPALSQAIIPTWTGLHTFTSGNGIAVTNNQNATTSPTVTNTSAGANAQAVWRASNGTGVGVIGIGGTGNTTTLYTGRVLVVGASAQGVVIGNEDAMPTIVSVSLAEAARFDGSTPGLLTLGFSLTRKGQLGLYGNTSGMATITPQAIAGTPTLTLPNASGTFAVSGTLPIAVNATTGDISCSTCLTTSSFANPTASVGLTAVNGSATTAMRSDGAPALSQAIVPTWTGQHAFTGGMRGLTITVNQNANTAPLITNTSVGTSAQATWQATNDAGNFGVVGIAGSGYTTSPIYTGRAFAVGVGAPLVLNTEGAFDIIIGRNSTQVANFSTTTVLTLTPAAATNNQGLLVTQSGPASGAQTGPIVLDSINVTSYGGTVATAGNDTFGMFNTNIGALQVSLAVSGSAVGQAIYGITGRARSAGNGWSGDLVGTQGVVYSTHTQGGGGLFGLVGSAVADTGYSGVGPYGIELNVGAKSGITATRRIGVSVVNVNTGTVSSGSLDGAVVVSSSTVGGEWKNIVLLSKAIYGQFPTAATSSFFAADTASTPLNHFADFTNIMFSGNIINSSFITMAGATGLTTINAAGIGTTSTDRLVLQNTTVAAAGAQQYSPRLHFIGQGWKINATAASQTVDGIIELKPVQGSATPRVDLAVSLQQNAGGYVPIATFSLNDNGGNSALYFNSPASKNTNLVYSANAVNKWYVQNQGDTADAYRILNSDANGNTLVLQISQAGGVGIGTATDPGAGALQIGATTDATSTSTGAIRNPGGMSVNKRVFMNGLTSSGSTQTAYICQSSGGELIADSIACLVSSERFKTSLKDIADRDALAAVLKLQPSTGRYKPEGIFTSEVWQREHVWFSAEKVAMIDPRLVAYDNDGQIRAVDYNGVFTLYAGAIRQLKADNDNLRTDVEQLKRRIAR